MSTTEHYFSCPFCGEQISMIVETGITRQDYIEDCEVCCRPIQITALCDAGAIVDFQASDNF